MIYLCSEYTTISLAPKSNLCALLRPWRKSWSGHFHKENFGLSLKHIGMLLHQSDRLYVIPGAWPACKSVGAMATVKVWGCRHVCEKFGFAPLSSLFCSDYTMVSFVKPNLLGTIREFKNRFVNPITNGQCQDSTPYDVRKMKLRAHILHELLVGSVQVGVWVGLVDGCVVHVLRLCPSACTYMWVWWV